MINNLLLSLALVVALFSAYNENSDPEIGGGGNKKEKPEFGTYLTGDHLITTPHLPYPCPKLTCQ